MKIAIILLQTLLIIMISPLVTGFIQKVKNSLRMRKGASILQPYYNLFKLFSKEEIISENASWIFQITPFVVFSSVVTVLLMVPLVIPSWTINYLGDFLVIIFLLSLGRFFMALAGLDTASAFGGMGASREMFISSMVEPITLLAIFTVSIKSGSTSLQTIMSYNTINASAVIASIALLIIIIVETSRVPIDNRETHLELTMVHEAMLLEYSGRSLALMELAGHIKQILFFSLLVNILFPMGNIQKINLFVLIIGISLYIFKIICISLFIGVLEISVAKMRLFRVVDFLSFGFVLSIIAMITAVMGY